MTKTLIIFALTVLGGCTQSGYKQYYTPYVDAKTLPDVKLIGPNEEPQVLVSNNLERDIHSLRAKKYIVVGHSSFNGSYEDRENVAAQAKRIGATLVITKSEYTETQSTTSALLIPNNQTTYHSGSVYSGGLYGGYRGTSTTYGTTAVPFTTHQRRYDQVAVYLVKSTQKYRFGVSITDLTPQMRADLERNTGAFIYNVFEDTPAFYSNVIPGDVLISINGNPVKNAQKAEEIMNAIPDSQLSTTFVLLRKGEEISIELEI